MDCVLSIEELSVSVKKGLFEQISIIKDFSLSINEGDIVGVIGESGCGKSITSLSIMGLLPKSIKQTSGEIKLSDEVISNLTQKQLAGFRGKEMAMIFQDPLSSLNPLIKIGEQIRESYMRHNDVSPQYAKKVTLDMMQKVGLPRVYELYNSYANQLSGGMCQRVLIAIALINSPKLLIADEPTTALDATIQFQILSLLKELSISYNTAIMIISHDLTVIKDISNKIIVMYAGVVVEEGNTIEVLSSPLHPYTKGLLSSIPTKEKKGKPLYNIKGTVESLNDRPEQGCVFAKRCDRIGSKCLLETPMLRIIDGRKVRCFEVE